MRCPLGAQGTILSSVMMVFSGKIGMNQIHYFNLLSER